jgi:hypothetical protein
MTPTRRLSDPVIDVPAAARAQLSEPGPGRRRVAPALAWSTWGLWLAVSLLGAWQVAVGSPGSALGIAMVGFSSVGVLVASRQPRNSVGWLLLAFALAVAVPGSVQGYASTSNAVARFAHGLEFVWGLVVLVVLPVVFPDGRLVSRRWRPALWLAAAVLLANLCAAALGGLPEYAPGGSRAPLVDGALGEVVAVLPAVGFVLLVPAVILAAASVLARFRGSRGVERQQVKWFTFAALLVLLGWAVATAAGELPLPWADALGSLGWTVFVAASLIGVPSAVGIAILRHRLYDIDRIINKTVVYVGLTTVLLATYAISILVLGRVLDPLTGDSPFAVAASTLAVAALFGPARNRIQSAVDRRFYRHRYDAARTLEDFTNRLRHELDLDAVSNDLRSAAERTLQPTHVTLWLRR